MPSIAILRQSWPRGAAKSQSALAPRGVERAGANQSTWTQETGSSSGVRASIVAKKPGNSGGAKGCRKVDAR